jgi:ASC-1-like (ASCH) protein
MALGSQEERDAMIAEAEGGWLNLDTINKTNYELGEPGREQAAFTQQLADTFLSSEKSAESQLIRDKTLHKYKADNPIITSTSKKSKTVKDPFASGGFIDLTYGLDTSNLPWGTGMGPEDKIELAEHRQTFLTKFPDDISVDDINKFINEGYMTFDDRMSIPGRPDMWTFKFNDKVEELDGSDESFDMLYEAVYKNIKKEDSTRTVVRADYFEDFKKNNPQFETFAKAREVFDKIYEQNLQNKYGYDAVLSADIFKTISADEVKKLDTDTSGYSSSTYINDVESQESRSNTISNDIKDLNNAEMQKLYETLIQRKYAGSGGGGGGAGLNKDEAELLRQIEEQLAKETSLSSPGS